MVKVNLAGLTIERVTFSQNVTDALGSIIDITSGDQKTYRVKLLFSFKGVSEVEVPEERIRPA